MKTHSIVFLNVMDIWSWSDCIRIRTHNHLVCKGTRNLLARLAKWLRFVVIIYLYGALGCMLLSCHIRVWERERERERERDPTLQFCQGIPFLKQAPYLKFKLQQGDSSRYYLVPKSTLNHLAKWAKWLSSVVNTYLYGLFACMLLSCHVRVWEWIQTL